jgi:hypothetical protein
MPFQSNPYRALSRADRAGADGVSAAHPSLARL